MSKRVVRRKLKKKVVKKTGYAGRVRNRGKREKKRGSLKEINEVLYVITDSAFPKLEVLNTANAWWKKERKVEKLIDAFKYDMTIREACIYAGISEEQYKYFVAVHPNFSQVIERCRELPVMKARETLVNRIKVDGNLALRYLERKKKKEFSPRSELTGPDGGPIETSELSEAEKKKLNKIFSKNTKK